MRSWQPSKELCGLHELSFLSAPPDAPARALTALTRRLVEAFDLSSRQVALWQAFSRACLERLSSECASLDPGVPLDSRFISCLLVK